MLGVYSYVLWGNKYDIPYREMIRSVLPVADEVCIVTDPRFDDGTIEAIKAINDERINLKVIKLDLDNPGFDGATKTLARGMCKSDILLQMDGDEIIRKEDLPKIKALAENFPEDCRILSTGVVNWFNGKFLKYNAAGWTKERMSRNLPEIVHGIPKAYRVPRGQYWGAKKDATDGAGYIHSSGYPLHGDKLLCNEKRFKRDYFNKDSIWIHHLSWFSLPRKWQMKTTWQYMWGNLWGKYDGLGSYKVDEDGNEIDFWNPPELRSYESYKESIINEMNESSIFPAPPGIILPELAWEWAGRQYIYDMDKKWKIKRWIREKIGR